MSERTRPAARAERPRGEQPPEGATARTATRPPVRGLVHSDDERLRRAATGADALGGGPVDGDMAATLRRRRGHGAPLPADVARSMGEHLQRDLSDVRVHADAEADTLSRSVQARAFTLGSDVYFTAGAYNPRSAEGQHLLAHELTHVVQQSAPGAGAVQRSSMTVGRADDPAEVEAERNATRVVQALRRSPAATGAATTAGPVAVEHQHGSGCGHDMTIRRHFLSNLFSRTPPAPPAPPAPTLGARARGLHEVEADDPSALDQLADIADAILAIKDATVTREEKHTLGDMDGGDAAAGLYGSGMGLVKMGMGAKDVFGAAGDLHAARQAGGDSLARNDKGVELEGGLWDLLGDTTGTMDSMAGAAKGFGGKDIPVFGDIANIYTGVAKGKQALEDGAAAGRLQNQKIRVKREQDHHLPNKHRLARFREFAAAYLAHLAETTAADAVLGDSREATAARKARQKAATAARKSTKPEDIARFEAEALAYRNGLGAPSLIASGTDAEVLAFLDDCRSRNVKEFGYGTEHRKRAEQEYAASQAGFSADYTDTRSLGKLASFGTRRKAETAAVSAVEAAGNVMDAAGTVSAAGDFGATKITGKALKATAAGYSALKSGVKRAKRIHHLRTVKNEIGYGGQTDRGVWWGAKQFFGGKVDSSQANVRAAIEDPVADRAAGRKGATLLATATTAEKAALSKRVTRQVFRRIDDLVRCLGSTNDQVFARASKILHIIAETNLAGFFAKIDAADLAEFRRVSQAVRATPSTATQADKDLYQKHRQSIHNIVERQLHGIGG